MLTVEPACSAQECRVCLYVWEGVQSACFTVGVTMSGG
jgi:hypothetical protein